MGKRLLFLLCLTLASFCSSPASAAPQTITAEGTCIVGDTDAPKDARDAARKEALRAATERMPSEKAMSVAIGMPQPALAAESPPALTAA